MNDMNKTVTVTIENTGTKIIAQYGMTLLNILRAEGYTINSPCGGFGKCGKCRVKVNGSSVIACTTLVIQDMIVRIPDEHMSNENAKILTMQHVEHSKDGVLNIGKENKYAVAIDLGTTTVAIMLLDLARGSVCGTTAFVNPQIIYGSDVISRIEASVTDPEILSRSIREKIDLEIQLMLKNAKINPSAVVRVTVAGNTTMSYILLGLSCHSLGYAPFTPEFTFESSYSYGHVFQSAMLSCPVIVIPYLSAFVGGDITAGILSVANDETTKDTPPNISLITHDGDNLSRDFLLVDLGTNGEIVQCLGNRLVCTAAAAGPAFEGGDLSCGMGGTTGAISHVTVPEDIPKRNESNSPFILETIGDAPARGICGSGLLDLIACLLEVHVIDETGAFTPIDENPLGEWMNGLDFIVYDDNQTHTDTVRITQKDIRAFQLAKGAIRAGIEIVGKRMSDTPPRAVWLAGGFGQFLTPESAFAVGLLPGSYRGRVFAAGNTSLAGAVRAGFDPTLYDATPEIAMRAEEINLAECDEFQETFMDNLEFHRGKPG